MHGDPSLLLDLQYGAYAGGATLQTLAAAPFLALFGPGLWAWKLCVWSFGAAILLVGRMVARRLAGRAAGEVFAAWMVFAPTGYLHVSMMGMGSHWEVMLAVLLACWGFLAAVEGSLLGALGMGLAGGLAVSTTYTGLFALPMLACSWSPASPRPVFGRRGLAMLLGAVLGLLPWGLVQLSQAGSGAGAASERGIAMYGRGLDQLLQLAHVEERLGLLTQTAYWGSLYAPALGDQRVGRGLAVALVQAFAVLIGLVAVIRATDRVQAAREAMAPALLLAFLAAFLLVDPRGEPVRAELVQSPNSMRYLAPTVTLSGLCIARSVAGGPRLWGVIATVVVLGVGLTARLSELRPAAMTSRALHLPAVTWDIVHDYFHPRTPPVGILDEQDGDGWEEVVGWAADDPRTRRLQGELLGNWLASELLVQGNAPRALSRWLERLEATDREAVIAGLGRAVPQSPWQEDLADLSPVLDGALHRVLWARDRSPCERWLDQALADPSHPSRAHTECRGPASAWALGGAAAWRTWWPAPGALGSAELRMAEALPTLEVVGPWERAEVLSGMGAVFGELWGYDVDAGTALAVQLPAEDRALFLIAWDAAATAYFVQRR